MPPPPRRSRSAATRLRDVALVVGLPALALLAGVVDVREIPDVTIDGDGADIDVGEEPAGQDGDPLAPDRTPEREAGGPAPADGPDAADDPAPQDEGDDGHAPEIVTTSAEGFGVLEGEATAGSGPTRTFTVEVEDGLESHAAGLLEAIDTAVLDEERSWARDHTLVQVGDPEATDVRVVLADPATVDEFCGAAGLDTEGETSCWDGERAMLNADRWRNGVDHVDDLEAYRTYLLNHEVGHGLGHGHEPCPEAGARAPVMLPQTRETYGCEPNPWPYP